MKVCLADKEVRKSPTAGLREARIAEETGLLLGEGRLTDREPDSSFKFIRVIRA